jgi:hypothetical protein
VSSIRSSGRRRRWTIAAFLALSPIVSLTACSGEPQATPPEPRLPAAVASDLAARSDRVAALLAGNDVCGAAHAADELQAATIAAINAGDVPPPFQEELTAAANALVNEVNCPPPPPPPPPPPTEAEGEEKEGEDEEDGSGKGKKKGKKKR